MNRLLTLLMMLLLMVYPAWGAQEAGMIKVVKGTVHIDRGGQKLAAAGGVTVQAGDRIVSGADGSVGIMLRDNTILTAGPNSALLIDRFSFNPKNREGALDASLTKGKLSVVSGKIAKQSPEAVKFRTPTTVLAVRGTEFIIDAGEGGN